MGLKQPFLVPDGVLSSANMAVPLCCPDFDYRWLTSYRFSRELQDFQTKLGLRASL